MDSHPRLTLTAKMNPLEIFAVALGIANVGLLVRRSIWNFPFGLAMVACYFVIFREARLYGESWLQVFFFAAQGWGWWLWARAGGMAQTVKVEWMGWRARSFALVLVGVSSIGIGWAMARFTDAALPYADATIAGASVVAQVLLAMRKTENWALWIAIDVLSIWVYLDRALYLTAGLYVAFLVLATMGLMAWARATRRGEAIEA
jgi:nicotinamide mononucleotide transporter